MSKVKSMRKLAIILVVVSVAAFSIAYAASTSTNLTIQSPEQLQVQNPGPDVYFLNGYETYSASSTVSPESSVAGEIALTGKKYPLDPTTEGQVTGTTATITGSSFDSLNGASYVEWKIPVKNYGRFAAMPVTSGDSKMFIRVKINEVYYSFEQDLDDGIWKNTDIKGLEFKFTCPTLLPSLDSWTEIEYVTLKPEVSAGGVALNNQAVHSFTYEAFINYGDTTSQQ